MYSSVESCCVRQWIQATVQGHLVFNMRPHLKCSIYSSSYHVLRGEKVRTYAPSHYHTAAWKYWVSTNFTISQVTCLEAKNIFSNTAAAVVYSTYSSKYTSLVLNIMIINSHEIPGCKGGVGMHQNDACCASLSSHVSFSRSHSLLRACPKTSFRPVPLVNEIVRGRCCLPIQAVFRVCLCQTETILGNRPLNSWTAWNRK